MSPFKLHLFGSAPTEVPPTSAASTSHHDAPSVAEVDSPKVSSPRLPGGKLGVIFSRIAAAPGATIYELTEETGWQPHTVRAAISRLRRTGQTIILVAGSDGAKTYRLAGGEG
jgi:hypothetical protein